MGLIPESGKSPWSRKWQPTPVLLPGESHGQEPGGLQSVITKESDTTEAAKHALCFEPQGPLPTGALPFVLCPCRVRGLPHPGGRQPLL